VVDVHCAWSILQLECAERHDSMGDLHTRTVYNTRFQYAKMLLMPRLLPPMPLLRL